MKCVFRWCMSDDSEESCQCRHVKITCVEVQGQGLNRRCVRMAENDHGRDDYSDDNNDIGDNDNDDNNDVGDNDNDYE